MYSKDQYVNWREVDEHTHALTQCVIATPWPKQHPFHEGDVVLYLGEVKNMAGHIAFVGQDGKTYWGYHFDNLRVIPEDE